MRVDIGVRQSPMELGAALRYQVLLVRGGTSIRWVLVNPRHYPVTLLAVDRLLATQSLLLEVGLADLIGYELKIAPLLEGRASPERKRSVTGRTFSRFHVPYSL